MNAAELRAAITATVKARDPEYGYGDAAGMVFIDHDFRCPVCKYGTVTETDVTLAIEQHLREKHLDLLMQDALTGTLGQLESARAILKDLEGKLPHNTWADLCAFLTPSDEVEKLLQPLPPAGEPVPAGRVEDFPRG